MSDIAGFKCCNRLSCILVYICLGRVRSKNHQLHISFLHLVYVYVLAIRLKREGIRETKAGVRCDKSDEGASSLSSHSSEQCWPRRGLLFGGDGFPERGEWEILSLLEILKGTKGRKGHWTPPPSISRLKIGWRIEDVIYSIHDSW